MTVGMYPIGSIVRSINGETDTDEKGNDRETGPNAHGWIYSNSPYCGYGVCFTNGTCVFLEHYELEDAEQYDVATPEVIAARLSEVRAHDDKLNETEASPTGDDYNEISGIIGA